MDKIYQFKSKSPTGQLKHVMNQETKLQFYSEEEGEKSKDITPKQSATKKPSHFQTGYQTDDSDDNTPSNSHSKQQASKMSKFSMVCQQKVDGDNEDEPEFSDGQQETTKVTVTNTDHNYNIEEQAQKIQQKLNNQLNHPAKLSKTKQTYSQQNLNVNSDNKKQNPQARTHKFRHLIFGPDIADKMFEKHLMLTQRGLIYSRKCLKGPSDKFIKSKQVQLPEAPVFKEKCLVLDLDETLIHSCPPRENPQVFVTAYGDYGEEAKIGINIRPYCSYFLQEVAQYYTVYIFTASSQAYAQAILSYLDPTKSLIQGILTRNNCMETKNGFFIKDLRIIANKDLKNILIVDNLAHSFGFQLENGIPILEWHNDQNDQELKYLVSYLKDAAKAEDVREFNKRLMLEELMEFNIES